MHGVVIGGGYGGAMAAQRLVARGWSVDLVAPEAGFVQRVRLHHRVAGAALTTLDFAAWLGVNHVRDRAVSVADGRVRLASGRVLTGDAIVVAVGRRRPRPPGAYGLGSDLEADLLRARVQETRALTIVGGGFSAIELAGAMASQVSVTLWAPPRWRAVCPGAQARITRWLTAAGVQVRAGRGVDAARAVDTDGCPHELVGPVAWLGGPAREVGVEVEGAQLTDDGRYWASDTLQIAPGVWGVGDGVCLRTAPWHPGGCAIALPMGDHLGQRLGAPRRTPFRHRWVARVVEVGDRTLIQGTTARGLPTRWWWGAWPAPAIKRGLLRYATRMIAPLPEAALPRLDARHG